MRFLLLSATFLVIFIPALFCARALQAQEDEPASDAAAPTADVEVEDEQEVIPTTHIEVESIQIPLGKSGKIETLAMDQNDNLLIATSQQVAGSKSRTYSIEVYDPLKRKSVDRWPMTDVVPKMLHVAANGKVYVAGASHVAQLDKNGRLENLLHFTEFLDERQHRTHASGLTSNDEYFFLAIGDGGALRASEMVYRFKKDLSEPKMIVEKQFGCCLHIDLDIHDGVLLVAENTRHRVNRFTLDGELIERWGKRDRTGIEGFASCCNPVNFDMGPGGVLFTAESGLGRVKRFSPKGEFLGVVGYVDTTKFEKATGLAARSCYIPIEVSKDASHIYIMDVRANVIRVLAERDKVSKVTP